jgi:hypothetical protein
VPCWGQAVRGEQKAYHLQGAIEGILDDPLAVDLEEDGEDQANHAPPNTTRQPACTTALPCSIEALAYTRLAGF